MKLPLQITFRHTSHSRALELDIRERAERLDRFCDRIMACRVMVEAPNRRHHIGRLFHVRVDLTVPGEEIIAGRTPDQNHAHEDPHVACRDAFDAAERRLKDYMKRKKHQVKEHDLPPHGRVARLVEEQNCGFIERSDGTEVYFHHNSVRNPGFENLNIGDEVRFSTEQGLKGLQASTVAKIGKHHIYG